MKRVLLVLTVLISTSLYSCSIVGYLGKDLCKPFILEGLSRLQYRGYDSSGFACIDSRSHDLISIKSVGHLENLEKKMCGSKVNGFVGIGHTRWATHGAANEANAHPHLSSDGNVAVVHNGIVENYKEIREDLGGRGIEFLSDTDTESIVQLSSDRYSQNHNLHEVTLEVVTRLDGAFGCILVVKDRPDTLVVIRKGSPICIGMGDDEMFVASDFLAFAGRTDRVLYLPNESFALVTQDEAKIYDFHGNSLDVTPEILDIQPSAYEKLEHEHYMLKEIFEQKNAIRRSVEAYRAHGDGLWKQLGLTKEEAKEIKRINLIGCGTSWHAARIAQFFFEVVCEVPTYVHLASEFRYMPFFPEEETLQIAVSQSGETADTLEAIRLVRSYDLPVIAVTNVASSTMTRETTGHLLTHAGPEIAVASTKAFTAQLSALYWLAFAIAKEKGLRSEQELLKAGDDLIFAGNVLEETIDKYKLSIIQEDAKNYAKAARFMFLGRHVCYPFAMEAALKLKEISYIFAMGYPAGELKHGSIALVDLKTPVVFFSHQDPLIYKKLVANAQEVKARHGHLIAFAFEGQEEICNIADKVYQIPKVAPLLEPLAMTGLMQFFVYQIAKELGCDIDKPRNLAKAVTVE